jgi:hypothetical protein
MFSISAFSFSILLIIIYLMQQTTVARGYYNKRYSENYAGGSQGGYY